MQLLHLSATVQSLNILINFVNKNYFIKMVIERCTLRFAKLTENAFAPSKGSAFAAGFDLKRYIAGKIDTRSLVVF